MQSEPRGVSPRKIAHLQRWHTPHGSDKQSTHFGNNEMPRTQLLISVRSAAEATIAVDNGADWIDIKDPSRGSLGMASIETMTSIVAAVAGRVPVSAALGELIEQPMITALPQGISHAKMGLHSAGLRPWQQQLKQTFAKLPTIAPIAAAYVGPSVRGQPPTPSPQQVLQWAIDHRAAGVLLDTYAKSAGNLLTFCDTAWLRSFIDRAHAARLIVALAGSLSGDALMKALALNPDVIAVRGAACIASQREQSIDPHRVRALASLVSAHRAASVGPHQKRTPQPVMRGEG